MTYEENIAAAEKSKASRIYKEESLALTDERISSQIGKTIEELESIVDGRRIPITDTKRLQAQTLVYLKACQTTSTMPSMSGLSRSCGRTRQGFYDFISKNPDHPSSIWLKSFSDACLDLLQNSAMRNDINTIVSIFVMKSMYGLREGIEVITPRAPDPLGFPNSTPEEIAEKYGYLLDTVQEFDEVQ